MNNLQTVATIEHRCEALTISEIPPYRCTTSATGARQGREVSYDIRKARRRLAPLDPEHFAIRLLDEQVAERVFDIFWGELRSHALELA